MEVGEEAELASKIFETLIALDAGSRSAPARRPNPAD